MRISRPPVAQQPNGRFLKLRWIALSAICALLLGAALLPGANGSGGGGGIKALATVVGFDQFRTSEESNRELTRFADVYHYYASDPNNGRQLKHFRDAFRRIETSYVEEVPASHLIDAAIAAVHARNPEPHSMPAEQLVEVALDGMTAALDPHSAYLNPEELKESELITSGEFGGLGIQVTQDNGLIKIISPIEGTPADRKGLKPGDIITHLDGAPVAGMSLRDAVNAMRGEPGTVIQLTIQRDGQAPFVVAITRAVITIDPVRWRVDDDVGYIRIVGFNEKVADRVEEAMTSLRASARDGLRGLIIDLRNNPGGLLDQALEVSDLFLDDGTIVSMRGRGGGDRRDFVAEGGDLAHGLPIVVLINAGSASAAEIVAGALQDHERATVMGGRSFGKGSVQTVMRLPVEGALKLTTALYYTPSGSSIQAHGVEPDIVLTGQPTKDQEPHEADLPGALPQQAEVRHGPTATSIDERECPKVSGEEDQEVACAVSFLDAGSTDRFLATIASRPRL